MLRPMSLHSNDQQRQQSMGPLKLTAVTLALNNAQTTIITLNTLMRRSQKIMAFWTKSALQKFV